MIRSVLLCLVLLLTGCEFYDGFERDSGIVTNEYAHWNPNDPNAIRSPDWEMTSGTLYLVDNMGYSGVPDVNSGKSLINSDPYNNSANFRLNTDRFDFGSVSVRFALNIVAMGSANGVQNTDGIHIFVRYQSEEQLYYASVDRRDGQVVIKKKCPGGPTNGGTYYTLAAESGHPIAYNTWEDVGADIIDNPDGSVTIRLYRDGEMLLQTTDRGTGCAVLTGTGATGIRGDDTEFYFDNFTVTSIAD